MAVISLSCEARSAPALVEDVDATLLRAAELAHPRLDAFECRHDVEPSEDHVSGVRRGEVGRQGESGVDSDLAQRLEE